MFNEKGLQPKVEKMMQIVWMDDLTGRYSLLTDGTASGSGDVMSAYATTVSSFSVTGKYLLRAGSIL